MLVGQYRRRHHHRYLLAVAGCFECGAYGHLGLAKAYVATHQTVHGFGLLHIGFHVLCRLQLVGRILIEERGLQLLLQVGIVAEGEALLATAGSIELDKVAGNVLDVLLRTLLESFPLARAEC